MTPCAYEGPHVLRSFYRTGCNKYYILLAIDLKRIEIFLHEGRVPRGLTE